jgi:hypothetical protein
MRRSSITILSNVPGASRADILHAIVAASNRSSDSRDEPQAWKARHVVRGRDE